MASKDVKIIIAGDSSRLTAATNKAQSSLNKLKTGASSALGGSAGNLLKGGGIAAAATMAFDAIQQCTAAYYEDIKAQKLLAGTIRNITGASDVMIKSLDDQIQKLSLSAAVSDDVLRPAYSQLVQSTGSTTEAMRLLTLATNVSAGSGKSLESVSMALGKAYNGNEGALKKLGISLKGTSDFTTELEGRYKGLAETAAASDPMGRMAIQMEQAQEQIGAAFAPLVEKFSAWMASPAGVALIEAMVQMATILGDVLSVVMDLVAPLIQYTGFLWKIIGGILTMLVKGFEALGKWIGEFLKLEFVKGLLKPIMDALGWIVETVNGALDAMGLLAKETADATSGVSVRLLESQAEKAAFDAREKAKAEQRKTALANSKKAAEEMRKHLEESAKGLMAVGEKFKSALDFSFGLDESNNFSVAKFMEQTKKIVDAARKLPDLLKKLRKQGASDEAISNILAQGPEKGSAIAQGFLSQGGVKGYSEALTSLQTSGQKAAAVSQSTNTYEININKANMTAEEIITAIQKYERKTGKKVVF
jgi:hypothetical protein